MQISLKTFHTRKLTLNTIISDFVKENSNDFGLSLKIGIANNAENNKEAIIQFSISLNAENKFQLDCDYDAIFQTDTILNEELVKSEKFLHINAPAIAYPYVRAFISNVLLVSNIDPAILPVINFQKLFEDGRKVIP
jgi:preprotein translocase subunit SecB